MVVKGFGFLFAFTLLSAIAYAATCGGATSCNCGDIVTEDYTLTDTLDCSMVGGTGLYIGADDITIECNENTIIGNSAPNTAGIRNEGYNNVAIQNCNIQNFHFGVYGADNINLSLSGNVIYYNIYGLYFINVSDSNITNNDVFNDGTGMYFSDSSENIISGGTIYRNSNMGIFLDASSSGSNNNVITEISEMHDNTNGAIIIHGSNGNLISNNNIHNNCGNIHQIKLESSNGTIIEDNQIVNGTGYGIEMLSSSGVTVQNNNISYNGQGDEYRDGIWGYHIVSSIISGNNITHNRENGIRLDQSSDITIENNLIEQNNNKGIYFDHVSDSNILNNTFYNNQEELYIDYSNNNNIADNHFEWSNYAIEMYYSSYNNILRNEIQNTENSAIYVENEYMDTPGGPGVPPSSHHIIKDNVILSPAQSCGSGCGGIELYIEDNCLIQNNTIIGSGYNGISLYGSEQNQIIGNIIDDYYNMAIRLASRESYGGNNLVANNTVSGNGCIGVRVATFNNTISGNFLSNNDITCDYWTDTYGMYVKGGSNPSDNVIIGNDVRGFGYGIFVDGAENAQIVGNVVGYGDEEIEGWALTQRASHTGNFAWDTNYRHDNIYTRLYKDFDFSQATDATLSFWMYLDTEDTYDYVRVYTLGEYGNYLLGEFSGNNGGWNEYVYDVDSEFSGSGYLEETGGIMFVFFTDHSVNGNDGYEGAFIDDVT
ncbi:MAG: right-handed parallel beta-helix repeat-containing protein, partial [archaeon]